MRPQPEKELAGNHKADKEKAKSARQKRAESIIQTCCAKSNEDQFMPPPGGRLPTVGI
jgi:hypothetical protein